MLRELVQLIITQTQSTPVLPAEFGDMFMKLAAAMTAVAIAGAGIFKLVKRLLRRWLATEDLGSVLKKQTDVIESQGKILARQVDLTEAHTAMHVDLKSTVDRNLEISAQTSRDQSVIAAHLGEVVHQLDKHHDRLAGLENKAENYQAMASMVSQFKKDGP